jgi:hypothetical protein
VDLQCFAQTPCYDDRKNMYNISKKSAVKEIFNTVKATLNIIHKMCWKINTATGTEAEK